MLMPGGEFIGHKGFRDWYACARRTFKPNAQYHVKEIDIDAVTSGNHKVKLKIGLLAETYSDSDFGGENINMLVNEAGLVESLCLGPVNTNSDASVASQIAPI